MMFNKKFNIILRLTNMGQMHQVGLYLNDLNKFDGSAEMLVTELQHHDQLQKAFETVREIILSNA
jgi:hypothetical protein